MIFLPYLGAPIDWALRVWSALIVLEIVRTSFAAPLWTAAVCAGLGWLIVQGLTRLLGSRLAAARDWLWQMATGTVFDTSEQELRTATAELRAQLAGR